jgi:hypothetical protein
MYKKHNKLKIKIKNEIFPYIFYCLFLSYEKVIFHEHYQQHVFEHTLDKT